MPTRHCVIRHSPSLNPAFTSVLRIWLEQSGGKGRLFDGTTGFRTSWAKLLKRAGITRFRWRDLRHHFASRLVQRGVPLSLRYAHLAPDQRREAVAKLNKKPILALTLRLPWTAFSADGSNFVPIRTDG